MHKDLWLSDTFGGTMRGSEVTDSPSGYYMVVDFDALRMGSQSISPTPGIANSSLLRAFRIFLQISEANIED
jgi:hypothetical protein